MFRISGWMYFCNCNRINVLFNFVFPLKHLKLLLPYPSHSILFPIPPLIYKKTNPFQSHSIRQYPEWEYYLSWRQKSYIPIVSPFFTLNVSLWKKFSKKLKGKDFLFFLLVLQKVEIPIWMLHLTSIYSTYPSYEHINKFHFVILLQYPGTPELLLLLP